MTRFMLPKARILPALLLMLMVCIIPAVAQDTVPPDPDAFDFLGAFGTLAAIVGLVTTVTEALTKLVAGIFKYTFNGKAAVALSWVVSIGLVALGLWQRLGLFSDPFFNTITTTYFWIYSGAGGLILGLLANGVFKVEEVKTVLKILRLRVK